MTSTMTQQPRGTGRRDRSDLAVALAQLRAIEIFNDSRRAGVSARAAGGRESSVDAARRVQVLDRQHEAAVARLDAHLRSAGFDVLRNVGKARAVLATGHAWTADKFLEHLRRRGFNVVACLDNGADAVGAALAEQPELVLIDEVLAMMPSVDVVRELRAFCPAAIIAVHVRDGGRSAELLGAGADVICTPGRTPPEIVEDLAAALNATIELPD